MRFLFLDRDGVINIKKENAYIEHWGEFEFIPGALEAFSILRQYFSYTFIITNQQGIGKEIMSQEALNTIHQKMQKAIEEVGGKIDAIYHCPHLASQNCNCRKPKTGLALAAKADFPEIEWKNSFLLGDSLSDIQAGNSLKMNTFYCGLGAVPDAQKVEGLAHFAKIISTKLKK